MKDNYFSSDCIYALATGVQCSAIAVFRLSGEGCLNKLNAILDRPIDLKRNKDLFYRNILDEKGNKIDEVVVAAYKKGYGYTREESAEISTHGSIAVIKRIDELLLKSGFRIAERGEFTYRAMRNGTLTLLEAEAVRELIESDSDKMREKAIKRLSGQLDNIIDGIYHKALHLRSIFELQMDYSEDEFDEDISYPAELIAEIKKDLRGLMDSFSVSRKEAEGIKIVLLGATNAGKSTLFNYLLHENRSIVSSIEGTTRDYIAERVEINGEKVLLYDTAGIRNTDEEIEKIGIECTKALIESADIIIKFIESEDDLKEIEALKNDKRYIFVHNKCDKGALDCENLIEISALTGEGISALLEHIIAKMNDILQTGSSGDISITSARQFSLIERADNILENFSESESIEILSIESENLTSILEQLLGIESNSDYILDEIFSRFCVGK